MGKIAFLFAGQGAQYPGMGADLLDRPAAAEVFHLADSIRPGTSTMCFSGTQEELSRTVNTQPALFAVDLACARTLRAHGVCPDVVAGFSLGEIAALAFAGVYSDADAFRLVCARGEAMDACAERNPGAMTAVLRLPDRTVEDICRGFRQAYPVNYNCDGQVTVACSREEIDALETSVREHDGRSVRLAVSGAFHSPFMDEASESLRAYASELKANPGWVPVYANCDAAPYVRDGETVADLVGRQINHPVRWKETIRNLAQAGVDVWIEVGAGRTLSGLCRKILGDAKILRVENLQTLEETLSALA